MIGAGTVLWVILVTSVMVQVLTSEGRWVIPVSAVCGLLSVVGWVCSNMTALAEVVP